MEKKTYIAPQLHVHEMVLEAIMNSVSLGDGTGERPFTGAAMAKGGCGPIFDDDDYDDDDFDF